MELEKVSYGIPRNQARTPAGDTASSLGPLGGTAAAQREPQIIQVLRKQSAVIDGLEKTVAILSQRLSPVTRQAPPSDVRKDEANGYPPAIEAMESNTARVARTIDELSGILDRLEV